MPFNIHKAASEFGWLLGLAGFIFGALALWLVFMSYHQAAKTAGVAPVVEHPVQELANPTPLPTALQMCSAVKDEPGIATAELWRFITDGHYELHVWENRSKANEVGYVLTFQAATFNGTPAPVAIDITSPGQKPTTNSEPTMSTQLRDCLHTYKPIDKVQAQ